MPFQWTQRGEVPSLNYKHNMTYCLLVPPTHTCGALYIFSPMHLEHPESATATVGKELSKGT